MKFTNNKKKVVSYIIALTILAIIARLPYEILSYLKPNPIQLNLFKDWFFIINYYFIYFTYLYGIVSIFFNPIYKFIKLKFFKM